MDRTVLDRESALALLHEQMQNQNLRRHCYAVGKVLADFYDYFQEKNLLETSLSKDQWEVAGILHDADWEKTKDSPSRHTLELLSWLENYEIEPELLNLFKSHNSKITGLRRPETLLEWALECSDELTGFIVAVALVMPSKKLTDVTVESVLKKFKQKEFAKQVEREQILLCEEKLGIDTEEFVKIVLNSMKNNSDLLGL